MSEALFKAISAALVGGMLGWSANALTLTGRVTAIEAGQLRLEAKVDRLLDRDSQRQINAAP